jgi:hypothetical protein
MYQAGTSPINALLQEGHKPCILVLSMMICELMLKKVFHIFVDGTTLLVSQVAARSEAWAFSRLVAGPWVRIYGCCAVLCTGRGLATGRSHVQGVLPDRVYTKTDF